MEQVTLTDCSHCGHRLDEHDRVALRYCSASGEHGVNRGCICHGQVTTAAEAAVAFHA